MVQEIEQKVIEIVAKQAGVDPAQVVPEHSFINDLGMDSLDLVEMAMAMEDVFGLSIPDDRFDQIKTVAQAIEYVAEQMKKAECGAG